jgi:hypothetical protein
MTKTYEHKIDGVVRERLTVNGNRATLEILAFDGKLMHKEWYVEGKGGRIKTYRLKPGGLRCSGYEDERGNIVWTKEENCLPVRTPIPWKEYDPRGSYEIWRDERNGLGI